MSLKYLALLIAGLAIVGCSDEDLAESGRKTYHSGDAIAFGVSASVPAGNENAKNSRTVYGDHSVNAQGDGTISINWENGDLVDIACPEASETQLATYSVPVGGQSNASGLQLVKPEAGLRWNGVDDHHFYGTYPSNEVFSDKEKYPADMQEKPSFKLQINDKSQKAVGFLPLNYIAKAYDKTIQNGVTTYTITPNMDYAFMVANKTANLASVNTEGLSLAFSPLATVLEFEIKADLKKNGIVASDGQEILLDHVELISKEGNISGSFEYDFATGTLTNTSVEARTHLNMYLNYKGMDPANAVKLSNGDICKINVFMMPDKDIKAGDLQVRLWFVVDGKYQRQRVATLGRDIKVKHKYLYRNFQMPTVNVDIQGSTWFSAIDDDVLMNQISMICAGNAFSSVADIPWYSREQVDDYKSLWNEGVRAFEFVTQSCGNKGDDTPSYGLRDRHFVCGEIEMDGQQTIGGVKIPASVTFEKAFASLAKFLILPKYADYHKETVMLIVRYHAVNDGYSPSRFVKNLSDFLTYATTNNISDGSGDGSFTVPEDRYVLLTANSTAGNLKGKIAIVVRPGDDDYCSWMRANNVKTGSTADARNQLAANWQKKLCYVENWGSAYDRWDTRYSGYAREATWNTSPSLNIMEDNLWGVGRTKATHEQTAPTFSLLYEDMRLGTEVTAFDFKDSNPSESFNFKHTVNGKANAGYIQEWARVIPQDFAWGKGLISANINGKDHSEEVQDANYQYLNQSGGITNSRAYLWFKWPSSYQQKLRAVKNVFEKSVTRVGKEGEPLCINVLSGYYADEYHSNSFEPFKLDFTANNSLGGTSSVNYNMTFTPKGQGNGGNYAALAAQLNSDVYEYLTSNQLKQGPWGLVQINYLNATADEFRANTSANNEVHLHGADASKAEVASRNLLKLFIANNFSFPLKKGAPVKVDMEMGGTVDEIIITE